MGKAGRRIVLAMARYFKLRVRGKLFENGVLAPNKTAAAVANKTPLRAVRPDGELLLRCGSFASDSLARFMGSSF